jgi:putative membrane protein
VPHTYWNDMYFGWGWILWFGIIFLFFSSIGNWGYTYRAHRRYGELPGKDAVNILHERYARGEITQDQLRSMKSEISKA